MVKMIYIDPPYNTGNAFEHYDDGLQHSLWLNLMKPRLEILKSLLSNDGILFISIDDEEVHYLKILSDEIKIPKNSMDEMLADISDDILRPIRSKLTETFMKNNNESEEPEEEILEEDQPINERLKNLSAETQDAIIKSNYQKKLYEIGKANQLSVDQMGMLENLLIDVILNKVHPEDFESVLEDTLKTDAEKSQTISNEINDEILKDIRNSLIFSSSGAGNLPKEKTELETLLEIKKEIKKTEEIIPEKIIPPVKKIEVPEKSILPEIMPEELISPKETEAPKIEKIIIPQKPTVSISAQKFSSSFKIPTIKTDYSAPTEITTKVPVPPAKGLPKVDPYREIPQ